MEHNHQLMTENTECHNFKIGKFPFLVYYHTVSDRHLPHLRYLIHMKTSKELETDLDYLGKHFKFITLAQFQVLLENGQQSGKRKLVLTFDDGYSEVSDIVQPLLIKKGIPAAFFVPSRFLDNKDMFYRCKVSIIRNFIATHTLSESLLHKLSETLHKPLSSKYDLIRFLVSLCYDNSGLVNCISEIMGIDFNQYLEKYHPYLSHEQIYSLLACGFEIGAHSMDHPFYGKIALEEQLRQTSTSMDFIQHTFKLPYRYFALPHSDVGVSAEFYYHVRKNVDLLLGGYGLNSYPQYHYFQRFSIEKYGISPSIAWKIEATKVLLKKSIYPSFSINKNS